jgi:segregation and condensation protein A
MSPAQEAIAILTTLAEKGEIDPWNIQVIEVIDRFLEELGLAQDNSSIDNYKETDLPQSGQAFLWASKLVLFKADTLERLGQIETEEECNEEFWEDETDPVRRLPLKLENHIRRRPAAPPLKKRRVTLQELIEQIKQIEQEIENKPIKPRQVQPRQQSRKEATRLITQLAHDENLTEIASRLEQFLLIKLPQLTPGENSINLDQLVEWWSDPHLSSDNMLALSTKESKETHHPQGKDKVGVFWALLLLSAQSKVELSQKEFYQDLTITSLA